MPWSLSEFLGLLDARSVCWGTVELTRETGARIRPKGGVMFYAVIDGTCAVSGLGSAPIGLATGDVAIVVADTAHAVRASGEARIEPIDFLDNDEYGDMLHHVSLGDHPAALLLCGRLKVRWPAGIDLQQMPQAIRIAADDCVVNLRLLLEKAPGYGASALMTRAAALLLTEGLREHPDFQAIFRDSNFRDPISRALQYIELHPHISWTVSRLAAKVGMARSTFAGRFHAEVGKTPFELLTEARMRKASELLEKSDSKLSDIAESVGYRSLSAFSHRFEQYFGMPPGRMRSLARQGRKRPDAQQIHSDDLADH